MSCCGELGFDPDYGIRVSKSADLQILLNFPSSVDLSGYDSAFAVKAELDDASALLSFSTVAAAGGSVIVIDDTDKVISLTLKKADLQTLPDNPDDASDPWTGWFEWTATDSAGLVSRLYQLPLIAERGAAE